MLQVLAVGAQALQWHQFIGRLDHDPQYACPRCLGNARPIDGRSTLHVKVVGTKIKVHESKFLSKSRPHDRQRRWGLDVI